ncbi:uncharacterized protein LOC114352234 [Ostrinia furnacalis]|uniref:uncharacterized protein LOC114352234 n=1 Tax=Ostrinia furnacalis TaxID=93504 RepID=UPI00103A76FB|nr:uncharacterized protein LOC114352234 [Ostrinia furnacalis]
MCFKEDLQTSSAELVYGETLRLPREFFEPTTDTTSDLTHFSARLRNVVQDLQPVAGIPARPEEDIRFQGLAHSQPRFSKRRRSAWCTIQPSDTGPHAVLKRANKFFTILVKGKPLTVSIDRLKPAYLLEDTTTTTNKDSRRSKSPEAVKNIADRKSKDKVTEQAEPAKENTTRSGRHVRFPDHYRH